jgi:putative NADH-flavin reductase
VKEPVGDPASAVATGSAASAATPMRLFVAGAGGRTGRLVAERAVRRGHRVTAFVHASGARGSGLHASERLRIVTGDARDPDAVAAAMPGHDAVLSLLSHPSAPVVTIFSEGTRALADAAEAAGVRRFVAVSAMAVGVPLDELSPAWRAVLLIPHLGDRVYADMALMEAELAARARLDWTIVRPAVLTDFEGHGRYRVSVGDSVPGGITLARGDLADFLLAIVEEGRYLRERVAVAD